MAHTKTPKMEMWWDRLTPTEREAAAQRVGTSPDVLRQVSKRYRTVSLGYAMAFVAAVPASGLSVDDLPLSGRARKQREQMVKVHREGS